MWSISELARVAGVSTRTLRHYDALGLLRPAATGQGGRRRYGQAEALRLQQIRLLTSLELSLGRVAEVLASPLDARAILSDQAAQLQREQERLNRMGRAIVRTLARIDNDEELILSESFDGFGHDPYEQEARDRYGDAAIESASERIRGWSRADAKRALDA